jgi:glycosyltransferase involved in cell wall biosynthesis
LLITALRLPRHDVVVTMTDPPLLAVIGPILRARWSCGLIHWSQDLYPDLFPVIGVALPRLALALMGRIVRAALRRYDAVIAIGECMARRLLGNGVEAERIEVIPNWADPVIRPVLRATNAMRLELGLGDRFTVAYSGNFGLAHPLDALIDAATSLARQAPEIVFLLIGEGRGLSRIRREIQGRALPNLRLLPWQPPDRLAESLGAADLHLASMDERAEGMLVPSKVAGALAAGRPCILLGSPGSAAARLIIDHRCGSVLASGDGNGLAQAIMVHAVDQRFHRDACSRASEAALSWSVDRAAAIFIATASRAASRSGHSIVPTAPVPFTPGPFPPAPFIVSGDD